MPRPTPLSVATLLHLFHLFDAYYPGVVVPGITFIREYRCDLFGGKQIGKGWHLPATVENDFDCGARIFSCQEGTLI